MSRIGDAIMDEKKNGGATRYAPKTESAERIASVMLGNVSKLSDVTAAEIEKTAEDLLRGADEIALKLRELAEAIRHHSTVAADHMNAFVERATTVFQGALDLQARLRGEEVDPTPPETGSPDDGAPPPKFLTESTSS